MLPAAMLRMLVRTPLDSRRHFDLSNTHELTRADGGERSARSLGRRSSGYSRLMSKPKLLRASLLIVRAIRRPAWWLLAYSQRHTLALWWRSLRAELGRGRPVDTARLRRLATALYHVSADSRLSNAPELKSIDVVDDVVVAHTDEHWAKRPILASTLTGVDHLNEVRFA